MNFIKRNLISIFGTFLLGLTNLVIGIFLARWLSPAGVGQYAVIVSAITIISALATMGVGAASIYYINNQKKDISAVSTVGASYSIFVGLIVLIFLRFPLRYESYFGYIPDWIVWMAGLYATGLICVGVLYPIFVAKLEVLKFQVVQLLPRVILLFLIITLIGSKLLDVNLALAATAVGQLFGVLAVLWFLRGMLKVRYCLDWRLLKLLIPYGLKLNLSYIILLLNGEIGLLMIRFFLRDDFAEAGYYSRALRLGVFLTLVAAGIGPLLYAKWSSVRPTERQLQVERVSRVFFSVSILGLTVLTILARQIVSVLYGEAFLPAVPIMRILLIGVAAKFLLVPHFRLYSASGKPLFASLVLGISFITMVILMGFLVPKHLGIGAGMAFTLSNLTGLVVAYVLSCWYFNVRLGKCFRITGSDIQYLYKALMR